MKKFLLTGIFFTTLSLLMLEISLTRIFSVTMWYHFAFLAVSLAVFGIGVSGQVVYLFGSVFKIEHIKIYSLLCVISFLPVLLLSLYVSLPLEVSYKSIPILAFVYVLCALPFFFGGLCIALVFSQYHTSAAYIYFADLLGAGTGCVLTVFILNTVGGPPTLLVIAVLCGIGTVSFANPSKKNIFLLLIAGIMVTSILHYNAETQILDVKKAKGVPQGHIIHTEWNAISRVSVFELGAPFPGWALSETWKGDIVDNMGLDIDANAFSPIVKFEDPQKACLLYDIPAVPYHIRQGDVLIIGSGGGRDIVTALLKNCHVTAVEINPAIINITNNVYGEYSGHIYTKVETHIEDGRSFIEHTNKTYDIIQMSLVDTWAASASGAYALSETYLYTVDAFTEYITHLNPDGILAVTRWIFETPQQTLRLVSVGKEALHKTGVTNPEDHMIIVKNQRVATFLLKKSPFTKKEIHDIENLCENLHFDIVYTPLTKNDLIFAELITTDNPQKFFKEYPLNVSPTTDNTPFFFYTVRVSDLPELLSLNLESESFKNNVALLWLFRLIIISGVLIIIVLLVPLAFFNPLKDVTVLYFAFLGLGFMFVEIPLLQRFMLVLGHPTYSLSVVLFSLLVFGGIGSYFSKNIPFKKIKSVILYIMGLIVCFIILFPVFTEYLFAFTIEIRIISSVALTALLGIAMGMPFPAGIRYLGSKNPAAVPWAWGINGAASVLGSALAVFVAINFGFSLAFLCGIIIYGLAAVITIIVR
ncbi:MAG: hypothetical protein PVF58_10140 [Candidatus Methanofastidiosia archaeon]|jgi:hypothetical protein